MPVKIIIIISIFTISGFSQSIFNDNFYNNSAGFNTSGYNQLNQKSKIQQTSYQAPESFYLGHLTYNPFSSEDNIYLSIPKEQTVKITILNMLGQKIDELLNKKLKEGTYKISYESSELSPGIYIFVLLAEGYNEIKKILVMK